MRVISTSKFVILTGYYHITSKQERVPTQVQAERQGSEGGVGRVDPAEHIYALMDEVIKPPSSMG
jgi:hypothetical protein